MFQLDDPSTVLHVGDCRPILRQLSGSLNEAGGVDLIFADPPFGIGVDYGETCNDKFTRDEYLSFSREWLVLCANILSPRGSLWVNIPDEWAADVVVYCRDQLALTLVNWCLWHYRFGQHTDSSFIRSKVHALYFAHDRSNRIWNPDAILEDSDRASVYGDSRTLTKKSAQHGRSGKRVPLDVWYGEYWGRIQGNNKERRPLHQNQLPEAYLERVIRACSNPDSLVLDPFAGSGTTLTVARALGRPSIGIEINPQLAASAFDRVQKGAIRL